MKQFTIQQSCIGNNREDLQSSFSVSVMVTDRRDTMICPKPRRFRWQLSHKSEELCDSRAGSDILDMILTKQGGCRVEQLASSPPSPFFSGSPPSRVANPLIHDARFGDEKIIITPLSQLSSNPPAFGLPSSSPSRKGGCIRSNFGNKPAVRVEGFDCLDKDRRNCSIPALMA